MKAEGVERERRTRFVDFLSRLVREQPLGTVGGIIVLLLLCAASSPMCWLATG